MSTLWEIRHADPAVARVTGNPVLGIVDAPDMASAQAKANVGQWRFTFNHRRATDAVFVAAAKVQAVDLFEVATR